MKAKEILEHLDSMNEQLEFPVLDNYNFDLAQCRLTVFRTDYNWLLTIETVGVNPTSIDNTLYAFSNFLEKQGIILAFDNLLTVPNEEWLFGYDGNIIVNPYDIHICLWERDENLSKANESRL